MYNAHHNRWELHRQSFTTTTKHITPGNDHNPLVTIHKSIPTRKLTSILTSVCDNIETGVVNISLTNKKLVGLTRKLLNLLSGGRELDLLSNVLNEREQISLNKTKPIFDSINDYLENDFGQNEQCKINALQFISPHIDWATLEQIGFNKNHRRSYQESKNKFKSNENRIKLKNNAVENRGRKSLIKNPKIRADV